MCWGDDSNTSTTTQNQTLPAWVSRAGQENFAAAKAVAGRPYEAFGGPRVAGMTAPQNQAIQLATGSAGSWRPMLDKSARAFGAMNDPAVIQEYMNPYLQGVLDPMMKEMQRQRGIANLDVNARAQQAGAFGDTGHAILLAENERAFNDALTNATGNAYATAFDRAVQGAMNQGQAYASLAQQGQGMTAADAQMLYELGEAQRQQGQRQMDVDFEEYLRRFNYPIEMMNVRTGALSGVPYDRSSTSTTTAPGANSLAQNLGAFGLLAGGLGSAWKAFS